MAFNVLKDPKDPRNFIVQPAPTGPVDQNLIQQGLAGGVPQGLPGNRPTPRKFDEGGGLDPRRAAERFGGPGDPRQFRRGLINFHGRLLKKTFERDKAQLWDDFARAGGVRTPEVEEQVSTALKSRGGFDAARDALADFRDMQPDKVLQREVDLEALEQQATRKARNERLTNDKLQNEVDDHKVFMGMPPAVVRDDRNRVTTLKRIAKRQQDAMVLLQQFGKIRTPTFTDADRAAVQREYEDIVRETTAEVAAGHEAGALTDNERDYYTEFSPRLVGITSPIQISEARVALGNLSEYFEDKGSNTIRNNRALREGSFPEVWDLGQPRTWQQIISLEGIKKGDLDVTDELAAARARTAAVPETVEEVPREAGTPAADIGDFFTGLGDIVGEGGKPMTAERRAEAAALIGSSVGAAAETMVESAGEFQRQTSDEEERRRLREAAGR
jgi:hypothetical protein